MTIVLIRNPIHKDLPNPISVGLDGLYKMAMNVLAKSSTAQQIIKVVDSSTKQVGLLISDSGESQHIVNDETDKLFNGGVAVVNINSPMIIAGKTLPVVVTVMHELGHAKQLIENEQWFKNMYKAANQAKAWANEGTYSQQKEAHASGHADVAALMKNALMPNGNIKPSVKREIEKTKSRLEKEFDSSYGGAMQTLEMDNIRKHEHPVITELGLGADCLRQSYP